MSPDPSWPGCRWTVNSPPVCLPVCLSVRPRTPAGPVAGEAAALGGGVADVRVGHGAAPAASRVEHRVGREGGPGQQAPLHVVLQTERQTDQRDPYHAPGSAAMDLWNPEVKALTLPWGLFWDESLGRVFLRHFGP
jgi:hypothetical protein